jgi:hypothetical protein
MRSDLVAIMAQLWTREGERDLCCPLFLRRHLYVIFRMADYSDASCFFPDFNRRISTGSKSLFRLFQDSGIRRGFNNFVPFDFAVFAE